MEKGRGGGEEEEEEDEEQEEEAEEEEDKVEEDEEEVNHHILRGEVETKEEEDSIYSLFKKTGRGCTKMSSNVTFLFSLVNNCLVSC